MIEKQVKIRVRYAETDQMGFVYYGNYATYFEVARVETFRQVGISYKELEDAGTWMPVLDYSVKFIKPAKYDDEVTISVFIRDKPGVRMKFEYEVHNQEGELLTTGDTTLVFLNAESGRPALPPSFFSEKINAYFEA